MSLSVYTYQIDQDTGEYKGSIGDGQMAGGESWRSEVYGSTAAKSLGLKILPTLNEPDTAFWQGQEMLDCLESEAVTLLENLVFVAEQSAYEAESIRYNVQNILDAVLKAKEINGGVVIW